MKAKVSRQVMTHANAQVAQAIRKGDIVRGSCEVCGTTEHVHAHHEDYSEPLKVMWLCRVHHRRRHVAIGRSLVDCRGDLRVTNIDDELMAQLKASAALARVTLRDFITTLLTDALKRRTGRQK